MEEFKLEKINPIYKNYPQCSMPFSLDNNNESENTDEIKEYLETKEKVSMISKINIQNFCKTDIDITQNKKTNYVKYQGSQHIKEGDVKKEKKKSKEVEEKQYLKIIKDRNKELNDLDMIRNTMCKISFLRDIPRDHSFWY